MVAGFADQASQDWEAARGEFRAALELAPEDANVRAALVDLEDAIAADAARLERDARLELERLRAEEQEALRAVEAERQAETKRQAKRERDRCVAVVKTHASAKPVLNASRAPGMTWW